MTTTVFSTIFENAWKRCNTRKSNRPGKMVGYYNCNGKRSIDVTLKNEADELVIITVSEGYSSREATTLTTLMQHDTKLNLIQNGYSELSNSTLDVAARAVYILGSGDLGNVGQRDIESFNDSNNVAFAVLQADTDNDSKNFKSSFKRGLVRRGPTIGSIEMSTPVAVGLGALALVGVGAIVYAIAKD